MRRGERFGPFLLICGLAHGGVSQIHLARHLGNAAYNEVVIKRLRDPYNDDDDFVQMLADEAAIMQRLRHPNVAQVYEFGQLEQQYFLATEYVDGVNLRQLMRRYRRLDQCMPLDVACYIMTESLTALNYAHQSEHSLVHRDFTPSNLMLSYTGDVKLIDFGIAKSQYARTKTRGGVIKGKVKYMSPEQTKGTSLTLRSDVFSAGVVAYECLTGRQPFIGETEAEVIEQIRAAPLEQASRLNAGLDDEIDLMLEKALAKKPEARFESAALFQHAIEDWAHRNRLANGRSALNQTLEHLFGTDRRESARVTQSVYLVSHDEERESSSSYTRWVTSDTTSGEGADEIVSKEKKT